MSNKKTSKDFIVFGANMASALERYYHRTGGGDLVVTDMPFDEILESESDGLEGEPGQYEYAQRRLGIRALFAYLCAEGNDPLKIMKRLYAAGRGFSLEPFCTMTMREQALMFGETPAAVSWRMKQLSGMIEQAGMKGSRLSGQKSKLGTVNYSRAQRGNKNRKKKTKNSRKGKPAAGTAPGSDVGF